MRSQSVTLISVSGPKAPPTPALLKTMSSPPKALDRRGDQLLDGVLVGDVRAKEAQPVGVADLIDERSAVVGVEVADDHAGPGGEVAPHGRPADAAGAAGDDGDPIGEHVLHRGDPRQPVRRSEDRTSSVPGAVRSGLPRPAAAEAGTDRRCRIGARRVGCGRVHGKPAGTTVRSRFAAVLHSGRWSTGP